MTTAPCKVDLEVDLGTFKIGDSIDLYTACEIILRGRGGKPLSLGVAQRWANPKIGYRPLGKDGPAMVLPTVIWSGQRRLMPEWAERFEAMRRELGSQKAKKSSLMGDS